MRKKSGQHEFILQSIPFEIATQILKNNVNYLFSLRSRGGGNLDHQDIALRMCLWRKRLDARANKRMRKASKAKNQKKSIQAKSWMQQNRYKRRITLLFLDWSVLFRSLWLFRSATVSMIDQNPNGYACLCFKFQEMLILWTGDVVVSHFMTLEICLMSNANPLKCSAVENGEKAFKQRIPWKVR